MAAIHLGGKVLVLTVDPARRLANALGLEQFGNTETRVPPEAFAAAGVEPRGELWAAMLDTKQSLGRPRPPPRARRARPATPSSPTRSTRTSPGASCRATTTSPWSGSTRSTPSGTYDLIVVDTPPTRNAIDFLEAPERMADFFSSRLLRWLTAPSKSRVMTMASKPFYTVADRILGSQFLEDIAEFFLLFQTMAPGFVERAEAVTRTLADRRTTFVVVCTLEAAPVHEAEFFIDALDERELHLGALVLNKVLPAVPAAHRHHAAWPAACAPTPTRWPTKLAERRRRRPPSPGCSREVGESFLNYQVVAKREAEQRAELAQAPEVVATVPYFDADIHDLAGLIALGDRIWR